MMPSLLAAALLLANPSIAQPASPASLRASVRMDSGWQSMVTPHQETPPEAGQWTPAAVPGFERYNPRGGSKDVWYRRKLAVPADWSGRRIVLDLRSARFAPKVFLDGRPIAERIDGWSPFEVDLTDLALPGRTHDLVVRCQDYGALLVEGTEWKEGQGDEGIQGKVLAPIGGYKDQMGLVSPVYLRSTPRTRIIESDLAIRTSVRRGELSVTGASSVPGARVVAEVWGAGKRVLRLPEATGTRWTTRVKFDKPRYWSPEDPYRYELRLTLHDAGGRTLDRLTQKFGFRELWAEGPDFVLNGVKRHLFTTSTWPVQEWLGPATVRQRLQMVKDSGVDTFRTHIGPWQEEFTEIADEVGLMMVVESAVYTDSGSYAYRDERFWKNYRDHLKGMVLREINRPSVVMWSLGNEILFMGNERHDPDLPKKLGSLAPFVKSLDPTRLTTFEADIDPDGKYDVIGLHYPHELPNVYAYPEAADWLGSQILTEAGGGMLGQKRTGFHWDRKKPLYIGEYLWVPHGDYSPGSVFYGDDAYLNRENSTREARAQSWIHQTIAYRRSGVSALCPWTVFDFGVAPGPQTYLEAQRVFYKRQMAWPRERGFRYFSGETVPLRFDIFNDGLKPSKMTLQVLQDGKVAGEKRVDLPPAGYADVTIPLIAPTAAQATNADLQYRLLADGKVVGTNRLPAEIHPKIGLQGNVLIYDPFGKWKPVTATPGRSDVLIFDPSSLSWHNSVKEIPEQSDGTVLVVAPGALDSEPGPDGLPTIGGSRFDSARFRRFLESGGRCLVLDQQSLAPLGLGLSLVDHASTMTFALDPGHPLLKGLSPDDLKHWRGDGYVTRKEIRREGVGGLRAITVSGGPESLAQAPIAEMPVGRGHVLLVQALVGSKAAIDPAAQALLRNAVDYLKALPNLRPGLVATAVSDPAARRSLEELGLSIATRGDTNASVGVVLQGGGETVLGARTALLEALRLGLPIYWSQPTPEAFEALKGVLGAEALSIRSTVAGPALLDRRHPLLRGVSREDLVSITQPVGWDRQISHKPAGATASVIPTGVPSVGTTRIQPKQLELIAGLLGTQDGRPVAAFDRIGRMSFEVDSGQGGTRILTIEAEGVPDNGRMPVLEVRINDISTTWLEVPAGWSRRSVPLPFSSGKSKVSFDFVNGARWGGPMMVNVAGVSLTDSFAYPAGYSVLAAPSSVVTWTHGRSTVVVDTLDWERSPEDRRRGKRYLSALLANLGLPFAPPQAGSGEALPNASFTTEGGRYNTADASRIELRSSGHAEIEFHCGQAGSYEIVLVASSTPADGEYAKVQVELDGRPVGEKEAGTTADTTYRLGPVQLSSGRHRLRLVFPNDASNEREDRNLVIRQVAFQRV